MSFGDVLMRASKTHCPSAYSGIRCLRWSSPVLTFVVRQSPGDILLALCLFLSLRLYLVSQPSPIVTMQELLLY